MLRISSVVVTRAKKAHHLVYLIGSTQRIKEEKVHHLKPEEEKDKAHFTDSETGVELELDDSHSLMEWFANSYKGFGATLEIITDKSKKGAQFVKGFGGIGGILRYQVDFQSMDLEDGLGADFDLDDY